MKMTPRLVAEINTIVQEEVQGALRGRKVAGAITERLDRKPVKLGRVGLRRIVSEAILVKQPGQSEPFQMDEKFGTYDVDDRYDLGAESGDTMMPHNFESAHHELFHQALQPVVDEFIKSLTEIFEAGMAPEGRDWAKKELKTVGEEMREELLKVIEKWTEEGLDRIA